MSSEYPHQDDTTVNSSKNHLNNISIDEHNNNQSTERLHNLHQSEESIILREAKFPFSLFIVKTYLKHCFTTLFPTKEEIKHEKGKLNPFPALRKMDRRRWNYFFLGFWTWAYDALDYFAISLNVSNIAKDLDRSVKDITWGITLVLMLRSIGAIVFGYLGDRYGRKWPMIAVYVAFIGIQLGSSFVTTYEQFLGVRAIFGIFMGGVYGLAGVTALESCIPEARSFLSGLFQQGYAIGYLFAVIFQRAITDNVPKHSWRSILWFSSGLPVILIIWRLLTPESEEFLQQKLHLSRKKASFLRDFNFALKSQWLTFIYLVILMSGISFMTHGSQDLYPTLLTRQLDFGADRSTVTNSVANLGAIAGGVCFGHFSGFLGRRTAIGLCCILGGAMIYPWAYSRNSGINAGVFFLQFMVQGALGVIPIHLSELSPPEFKTIVVGTSYQLGAMASSASSTIESSIGERFPVYNADGTIKDGVYDYAKVMSIFIGCVFAFNLIVIVLGPENRNADINFSISEEEKIELIEQGKIVTNPNRDLEFGSDRLSAIIETEDKAVTFHKEDTAF